ncbi:hypothetical protein H5410_000635 [Solanum commersonii]|uniref:Uncharacterized protein n=1 Tax=Solanum commersonii TaxID=4109 RepID=A0A9J6AWL3_SOLCO|nr:hypothetical protein H5410_000635 [Solanum commersonii]
MKEGKDAEDHAQQGVSESIVNSSNLIDFIAMGCGGVVKSSSSLESAFVRESFTPMWTFQIRNLIENRCGVKNKKKVNFLVDCGMSSHSKKKKREVVRGRRYRTRDLSESQKEKEGSFEKEPLEKQQ